MQWTLIRARAKGNYKGYTTDHKEKQNKTNPQIMRVLKVKYRYYFAPSTLKSANFLLLYKSVLNGELNIKYKSLNFASKCIEIAMISVSLAAKAFDERN